MDADERDIYLYMKAYGRSFIQVREVCRSAGGRRRFRFAPDWARPVMCRMADRGILESNEEGRYRLKPRPPIETAGKVWVTKELASLLQAKGKPVDNLLIHQDEDEYYETL